ncbi:antitoxin family protein [Okeania sp. SIO1I7]|uniref:antitoxin family protein n=1 Tax=Okeania sp. SIO1I7 TaxID=2607772 RepID=UPI0025F47B89|nr:antitoxin family protein [Okeania sp. SIO1I7]
MILEAVYEQGVLRLTKPLNLPEGTRVEITLVKSGTNFQHQKPADILAAFALALRSKSLHIMSGSIVCV